MIGWIGRHTLGFVAFVFASAAILLLLLQDYRLAFISFTIAIAALAFEWRVEARAHKKREAQDRDKRANERSARKADIKERYKGWQPGNPHPGPRDPKE